MNDCTFEGTGLPWTGGDRTGSDGLPECLWAPRRPGDRVLSGSLIRSVLCRGTAAAPFRPLVLRPGGLMWMPDGAAGL